MLIAVITENEISSDTQPIRVLIVDDNAGVRAGIRNLLRTAKDISIVGEAENGRRAIELANATKPDIILLDVQLPDIRGDKVLTNIHESQPEMKVLVLSSFSDREYVQTMMDRGANGYLTKDEAPTMLVEAIYSVIEGTREWISPRAIKNDGLGSLDTEMLTKREADIMKQLLMDRSDYEIGVKLGLDEKLVERYIKLLMKKLEADSLTALKRIAKRILPPDGS